jgi:methyl-accepting chemotaxis protein
MKLTTRILIPAGVGLVATIAAGAIGLLAMNRMAAMLKATTDHELATYNQALQLKSALGESQAFVYRQVTLAGSLSAEQIKQARAAIAASIKAQQEQIKALQGAVAPESESAGALAAIGTDLAKYAGATDQAVDMASLDPNTGVAAMQSADALFHRNAEHLDKVVQQSDAAVQAAFAQIIDTRARLVAVDIAMTLAAILATIATTVLAIRKITADIQACSGVANRVADGELSGTSLHFHNHEMGELLRNLDQMKAGLRRVLGEVQSGIEAMKNATREIAQGNDDLSRRTEQQASNLDTTTQSMAKMATAIELSAGHARRAESLVESASAVAARGGDVVGEVVQRMSEIQSSSRKIAEIIGVIDGIAFQTNILALNAAVEAARAGEQGRGFAVVAGEVRNLAQRSALAAREIKDLISNSVEKVEAGSHLVNDAGQTMTEIVRQVREVTDLISEITAATQVQSTDAVAVNRAVEQLDTMTQQNAALAEQSAAAAQSLRQHAENLASAVGVFKMKDAAPAPGRG